MFGKQPPHPPTFGKDFPKKTVFFGSFPKGDLILKYAQRLRAEAPYGPLDKLKYKLYYKGMYVLSGMLYISTNRHIGYFVILLYIMFGREV